MGLKEQLRQDMAAAMRAGDAARRDVLRMLVAAVKQAEVDTQTTLDDAGVQDVLAKQARQRRESIADYTKAGRPELVAQEEAELALIEAYLPSMLGRDEIAAIAQQVIDELGVAGPQAMGQVMGRLMPMLKGQAEGRLVNAVVRDLLSG